MSRLNIFLILILAGLLAFAQIQSASAGNSDSNKVAVIATPTPTNTPTPTPTPIPVGEPKRIIIPKINIDGPVVPEGVDSEGKMLMPENWYENAWYNGVGSVKPGEKGNAVIAGHLDTIFGTKGYFYDLSKLEVGDEITSVDEWGRQYVFVVKEKQIYSYNEVPIQRVFGPANLPHLNLITCTGTYIVAEHNYDKRLIVYTDLKQ
jgi:LPXTG-site transpeptidase (sortase) family protein